MKYLQKVAELPQTLEEGVLYLNSTDGSVVLKKAEPVPPTPTVEVVDLGLSVNWMTCNIGATKPEEYGLFFQWGDTVGYEDASHSTWKTTPFQTVDTTDYSQTKFAKYLGSTTSSYKDSSATDTDALKTVLDPSDDAAYVATNGVAHMPTKDQLDELIANTTSAFTTVNGVSGMKFTSNKEGYTDKYIFIPASGRADDGSVDYRGSGSDVWSSSLSTDYPYYAWSLSFDSDDFMGVYYDGGRYYGCSVRGVVSKN